MSKIAVRYRTLNSQPSEETIPAIEIDILNEEITTAQLIERAVEAQMREILAKQKLNEMQACQTLNKHYLTREEIEQQAATGTIRLPEPESEFDIASAVRRAKRAFQNRTYIIVAGGRRVTRLDEKISLRPGNNITFLRLVPLIGG